MFTLGSINCIWVRFTFSTHIFISISLLLSQCKRQNAKKNRHETDKMKKRKKYFAFWIFAFERASRQQQLIFSYSKPRKERRKILYILIRNDSARNYIYIYFYLAQVHTDSFLNKSKLCSVSTWNWSLATHIWYNKLTKKKSTGSREKIQ